VHTGFWWGNLNERKKERSRRRWEGIFTLYLQVVGRGSMELIDVSPDTDRWWALVAAVMKLQWLQ
jgi:hypothetical protein